MSFLLNPYMIGPPDAEVEHITGSELAASSTPSGTINFGVESADRRIAVLVHFVSAGGSPAISAATIGGVAATIHTQICTDSGDDFLRRGVAIISALVPTGTSGTLAMTFNTSVTCRVEPYRMKGLITGPLDTGAIKGNATHTTPQTVQVDVLKGGVVLAAGNAQSGGSDTVTGATKDYNFLSITANNYVTGASQVLTADELNRSISLTRTSGGSGPFSWAAASFR